MDSISLNLALINAQQLGDHMGAQMIMSMQNSNSDETQAPPDCEAMDANDMQAIAKIIAQALGLETALDPQQLLPTSDPNVFILETPEDMMLEDDDGEDMFFADEIQIAEIMH